MDDTTQAFGYLRVSGKAQVDGDGFPRQRATIEKWAAANGVTIVRWFQEEGITGTADIADRPAWQELVLALMSNGVKTVLIEKFDRLARDPFVQEHCLESLRSQGFTLISALEPDLHQDDPSREMMRFIFGAVSRYDKKMIVLKLRAARQRKRIQTGGCEGRKIYGQNKDAAFAQAEQAVIARIKAMHASGSNYEQIAKTLNAEGIAERKGSWFGSTVRKVILNASVQSQLAWLSQ